MSLRLLAEKDLAVILEDGVTGFGWPLVLIDPSGTETNLTGFSNDIGSVIDLDTGLMVSGRMASVAFRLSSLPQIPDGSPSSATKPWRVRFDDINLNSITFKLLDPMPDRGLGVITYKLRIYT